MTAVPREGSPLLTVDVEEWFHAPEHPYGRDEGRWDGLARTLPECLPRTLDLLAELGVKATFFTLGWAASRHPALIRRLAEEGHEVACHGWGHLRVDRGSPGAFRDDLLRGKAAVEEAISRPVAGYRAPRWSMPRAPWPYEILAESGFLYSSSRLSIPGMGWGPPGAHVGARVPEIPAFRFPWRWMPVPAGGTVALRVLPLGWLRRAAGAARRRGLPAVYWFHPWELLADGPRLDGSPLFRWARYTRLRSLPARLQALVEPGDRRLLPYVRSQASPLEASAAGAAGGVGLDGRGRTGP